MTAACSGPDCSRPIKARGLCNPHHRQWLRGNALKPLRGARKPCKVTECRSLSHARGLCSKHYQRFKVGGSENITRPNPSELVDARIQLGMKECSGCSTTKKFSDFYGSAATRDGLTSLCKPCSAIRQSQWHASNPEKNRERRHKRRILESGGGGIDVEALWADSKHECPDCGMALIRSARFREPGFGSIDHIIPLSRGGRHEQDNVRLTCLPCNLRKSSKIIPGITKRKGLRNGGGQEVESAS